MPDKLSVLDLYTKRVYKIVVMIIPIFCLCASATITTLHFLGFYPDINETAMWLFCASDIIYFALGIFFMKTGFDEDGVVRKNRLVQAKYVTATVIIIQWNAISYIWPFSDFWAYCTLFVIVFAFFFDVKLVAYETVGILVSMVISWFVSGRHLLPADDDLFVANMTFRLVGIVLMLLSINIITYFGGKFLVKEIEKRIYYDKVTENEVETLTRQMKEFSPTENASYETANIVDLEIRSRDEIKDIYSGIRSMQINIVDYLNHLSEMKREKEAKEAELGVATKIQADMLPKDFPEREDIELYTDGVPEAKSARGERFGMDRFADLLIRKRDLSPKQIVTDVKWEVDSFQPKDDPFDDVTMMSVVWKGDNIVQ